VRPARVRIDFAAIYFNPLQLNYDIVRAHGVALKAENLPACAVVRKAVRKKACLPDWQEVNLLFNEQA
jgi:hypothetical protein